MRELLIGLDADNRFAWLGVKDALPSNVEHEMLAATDAQGNASTEVEAQSESMSISQLD